MDTLLMNEYSIRLCKGSQWHVTPHVQIIDEKVLQGYAKPYLVLVVLFIRLLFLTWSKVFFFFNGRLGTDVTQNIINYFVVPGSHYSETAYRLNNFMMSKRHLVLTSGICYDYLCLVCELALTIIQTQSKKGLITVILAPAWLHPTSPIYTACSK